LWNVRWQLGRDCHGLVALAANFECQAELGV
jgi:hypothetical protein